MFPQIFRYDHPTADILHEDFFGRLEWHGTPDSDIQIGAVYLHNVTYNDTGTYRCTFYRSFILSQYNDVVVVEKDVELSVVAVGKATCTPEKDSNKLGVLIHIHCGRKSRCRQHKASQVSICAIDVLYILKYFTFMQNIKHTNSIVGLFKKVNNFWQDSRTIETVSTFKAAIPDTNTADVPRN